jgi:hypothetical protein
VRGAACKAARTNRTRGDEVTQRFLKQQPATIQKGNMRRHRPRISVSSCDEITMVMSPTCPQAFEDLVADERSRGH